MLGIHNNTLSSFTVWNCGSRPAHYLLIHSKPRLLNIINIHICYWKLLRALVTHFLHNLYVPKIKECLSLFLHMDKSVNSFVHLHKTWKQICTNSLILFSHLKGEEAWQKEAPVVSTMALSCAAMAGQHFQSFFLTSAPSTGVIPDIMLGNVIWRRCHRKQSLFRLPEQRFEKWHS